MGQIRMGIFDYEQEYAIQLMNYINADTKNPIFAMAFSVKERLLKYLKENHLDMLVVVEAGMQDTEIAELKNHICVITLVEQASQTENYHSIYKYSSAEVILKKLMQVYWTEDTEGKSSLFETYAVISPVGRSGKTRLAECLCLLDEVRGGLYIGLEAFGCKATEEENRTYTMSNLAYLIKTRSEQILEFVEQSIYTKENMGLIASPESYLDIRELDAADVKWFIGKLVQWGRYTTIVFDIGESVLGDIAILGEFDTVIVPVLEDAASKKKIKAFQEFLKMKELVKVAGCLKMVCVPDAAYDSAEMIRCAGRLVEH